jgi:uroporphyrinogen decarboxylase
MSHSILLDTIRGKEHQRPPVWFMRQAGRTLPYYQKLRKQYSFREIMNKPELAASVTLEPVNELGMDGAIIFTDILIVAEALGMKTNFGSSGPTLDFSLQDASDPSLNTLFFLTTVTQKKYCLKTHSYIIFSQIQ